MNKKNCLDEKMSIKYEANKRKITICQPTPSIQRYIKLSRTPPQQEHWGHVSAVKNEGDLLIISIANNDAAKIIYQELRLVSSEMIVTKAREMAEFHYNQCRIWQKYASMKEEQGEQSMDKRSHLDSQWYIVSLPWGDDTCIIAGNADPHIGILVVDCTHPPEFSTAHYSDWNIASPQEIAKRIVKDHNEYLRLETVTKRLEEQRAVQQDIEKLVVGLVE